MKSRSATSWMAALVALVGACAWSEPLPPPVPPRNSDLVEQPIQSAVPRPAFLECTKGAGPARPLNASEVLGWVRGKRRYFQDQVDLLELALSSPDEDLLDNERYEMTFRLAVQGLGMAEENARNACHFERSGDDPDALQAEWASLQRNLALALQAAESVFAMNPSAENGAWMPLEAPCLLTLAASRLGDVERARLGAAALHDEIPCSLQALVEFGHALHERGLHAEGRAVFERAVQIETELTARFGELDVACPSAHPEKLVATLQRKPQPHLRVRWCSWADYLKYRQVHSALALGELDRVTATLVLGGLAADLRQSDRQCVETIIDAIEDDVEHLADG